MLNAPQPPPPVISPPGEGTATIRSASGWPSPRVWALALAAVAGLAYLFCFNPAKYPIYPVCEFHRLTGLDCPACGMLRGTHQLLRGHPVVAWHYNPLAVLTPPLFCGFLALRLYQRRIGAPPLIIQPRWIYAGVALLLLFGVLRNLPL